MVAKTTDFDDPNVDHENADVEVPEDDSPYPEVRSAVGNTDAPVSTLRVWVLDIWIEPTSVSISGYVAVLISLPLGRAWAAAIPNWRVFGVSLDPGPFLTIMSTVTECRLGKCGMLGLSFTIVTSDCCILSVQTDIIAVQRLYYNQT
ncbi:hypothetical protein L210DRAFT_3653896 [Boletus edulis BED1]|uniref:Uncharacterized protein n=1 Tax=Boletus edulis BED1 TaxID=1328754 RepID=A0AAD4G7F2_BOLED|nr:hypothetical protein L210DRAFT_3653896 [Boletus edulis BED1]